MRKYLLTAILMLASLLAGAQSSQGFKFSVGVGTKYMTDTHALDFSPELGFHYRANEKNMFGLGLMVDCVYKREDIFLSYTYDFLSKPASPYIEGRLGANIFYEKSIGCYMSIQGGYKVLLGKKLPLRMGLTTDLYQIDSEKIEKRRKCVIGIGLVLRTEF